jgi:hypothetical protein
VIAADRLELTDDNDIAVSLGPNVKLRPAASNHADDVEAEHRFVPRL